MVWINVNKYRKINDHKYKDARKTLLKSLKDKCVLCGKESPYTMSTHIDLREGYVEGGGQGCFQPNRCKNE